MESRTNTSTMESDDNMAMTSVEQGEIGQNYDDIMARRIKNRERQRRYRARKRLEADIKKGQKTSNFVPPQRQVQVNWAISCESRILCRRNWKQDARKVHMVNQQIKVNGPGNESNLEIFVSDGPDGDIEKRVVRAGRHWKADARNKKN